MRSHALLRTQEGGWSDCSVSSSHQLALIRFPLYLRNRPSRPPARAQLVRASTAPVPTAESGRGIAEVKEESNQRQLMRGGHEAIACPLSAV